MRGLQIIAAVAVVAAAFGGLGLSTGFGRAADTGEQAAPAGAVNTPLGGRLSLRDKQYAFVLFKKHCTQCHNSVADPERPGKTRDEWYRVVHLMESHGLDISQDDAAMIVDLLYAIRRGVEDKPG